MTYSQQMTRTDIPTLASQQRLYVLDVFIVDGPMTASFLERNPIISRRIEILGSQTLADLHQAIFRAFDRQSEHLYEFQIGGSGPHDPSNRVYGPAAALQRSDDEGAADVTETTLDAAGITLNQPFGYWFDFGDDWWHQINPVRVEPIELGGDETNYPRVFWKEGTSPPQSLDDE